jgi:hypothetical protein
MEKFEYKKVWHDLVHNIALEAAAHMYDEGTI